MIRAPPLRKRRDSRRPIYRASPSGRHPATQPQTANFVELITAHIGKENQILFAMADDLISGPACRELGAAYDALSDERFEGHSKADLVTLARTIVGRS